MPSYIIVDVTVLNESEYANYRAQTPATVDLYNGKFIVRGGNIEVVEGTWNPERLVIIEFSSAARAKEWWYSPEYCAIKNIRFKNAESNMLLVEGYMP